MIGVADDAPYQAGDAAAKMTAAFVGVQPWALVYKAMVHANYDYNWNRSLVDPMMRLSAIVRAWFDTPLSWEGALNIWGRWNVISNRDKIEFNESVDPGAAVAISNGIADDLRMDREIVWYFMQRFASIGREEGRVDIVNPGIVPSMINTGRSIFPDISGKINLALVIGGVIAVAFLVREIKS